MNLRCLSKCWSLGFSAKRFLSDWKLFETCTFKTRFSNRPAFCIAYSKQWMEKDCEHILHQQRERGGGGRWGEGGASNCESSLVTSPRVSPSKKLSGEQSQFSWTYYPNLVRTNEIARSLILTQHFPYNSRICLFQYPYFFWVGCPQNVLNIARLHCRKTVH